MKAKWTYGDFNHEFEVEDKFWDEYNDAQKQHVLLVEKNKALVLISQLVFENLSLSAVSEEEEGHDTEENNGT